MVGKVAERKAKLRDDLIAAAETRIAADGIKQLRARDLAKDVGCAVGAIYNVFEDIDALVLAAGFRTLKAIDAVMTQKMDAMVGKPPVERMVAMAHTYFDFVDEHTHAWAGLFEHRLPADYKLPEWHVEGQGVLFRHIEEPLADLLPDESPPKLAMLARTLFSAAHGVVVMAREQRVAGVPRDVVKGQLEVMLRAFARGIVPAN